MSSRRVPRRHRFLSVLPALLVAAAADCTSGDDLVLPAPPQDLSGTAQIYETPTGSIDQAHLQQIASDARAELADRQLDWLPGVVVEALGRVRRRYDDGGYPTDPAARRKENRPRLDAVITIDRTCNAGGSINITSVIEGTELRRDLWGTASACHAHVQVDPVLGLRTTPLAEVNAFFDGTVSLYLQGPLPENGQQAELVVAISGQLGIDDQAKSGSFDFRVAGGQIEIRHAVADGDVIVSVGTQGIGVRGKNGSATCDLAALSCAFTP